MLHLTPDIQEKLKTVLTAFDGDIEAVRQALEALSRERDQNKPVASSDAPVIVELQDVSRQYRLGRERVGAVVEVALKIRQGEIVAITGPSGSGKSTLLNLMGALDKPDSGHIAIGGQDVAGLSDRQLSKLRNQTIGFVFQFFYLQPFLDIRTNLAVPGMFAGLSQAERGRRIPELAAAVGLSDRLDHLPKELSGGQMQRAAIARALLNRPKLILADEPTGNIDRANARTIIELFKSIRERYGTTIVLVTHDMEVAHQADRIIKLRDGRILA